MTMKKARPSALGPCARAPWLAARHQVLREEIAAGADVDAQVTDAFRAGKADRAHCSASKAICDFIWKRFGGSSHVIHVQRRVTLLDPEFREVLTEGTPDLLVVSGDDSKRHVTVFDWKKKGQLFAGYIDSPDHHLQQLAYGLAAALELDAGSFQVCHVFFDGPDSTSVEDRWSDVFEPESWQGVIERVRACPDVDLEGPEPAATEGDHCSRCWQQQWCSARLLPAHQGETALAPFTGGLTVDKLPEAIAVLERFDAAVKLASKKAWAQVEGLVRLHGPVRMGGEEYGFFEKQGNRKGPSVEELIKMGRADLIKQGEPKTSFGSRKAR